MRVLLTPTRQQPDAESGAVAVVVALLMTVFLGLTAFVIDLGYAYAVARQQSSSADAASLAAAAAVGRQIPRGASCAEGLAVIDEYAVATTAANAYIAANDLSGTTLEDIDVRCLGAGTDEAVEVTIRNGGSNPTFFAQAVSGISSISTSEEASARYVRASSAGGLRPWAVCDGTAQLAQQDPDTTFVTGLDNKVGICSGDDAASGNWGAVDFDGGSNPAGDLTDWTMNGYPGPVAIPDPLLPADPGISGGQLPDAFTALLDQTVLLPSVASYNEGSGGNASFDTVGVLSAQICGVRYSNKEYRGTCWDDTLRPTDDKGKDIDFIQFRWVNYEGSYSQDSLGSGASGQTTCEFTDPQCVGAVTLWR